MRKIFFLTLFIGIHSVAFAAMRCHEVLQDTNIMTSIEALARLKIQIETDKVNAPDSIKLTALQHDYSEKESQLVQMIGIGQLKSRVKNSIVKLQNGKTKDRQQQKEEEDQRRATLKEIADRPNGSQAIFHRIDANEFGPNEKEIKAFAMMATPVTQFIWREVGKLINKRAPVENTELDPSFFKGEVLPVENISYLQAMKWISGLNELAQENNPDLKQIFPDLQAGDIFDLPSEEEWDFVIKGLGQSNKAVYENVNEIGWFAETSSERTHPVGQKKALVINDKQFFDLLGNIWEFTLMDNTRMIKTRGGCWYDNEKSSNLSYVTDHVTANRYNKNYFTGFRLIKRIP